MYAIAVQLETLEQRAGEAMPIPIILGLAAVAGGSVLVTWYAGLSPKQKRQADEECTRIIGRLFGARRPEDLKPDEAKIVAAEVSKAVPEPSTSASGTPRRGARRK
jgi:hypothetical protein